LVRRDAVIDGGTRTQRGVLAASKVSPQGHSVGKTVGEYGETDLTTVTFDEDDCDPRHRVDSNKEEQ